MAIGMSSIGCSQALPHDFDPRKARDVAPGRVEYSADATQREALAVLLLPSNTTLSTPTSRRSWLDVYVGESYVEYYVGPARIFLPPGDRLYMLRVKTSDSVVEFKLFVEVEAGKRYELAIVENGNDVRFDLFELHESSYAALYPNE